MMHIKINICYVSNLSKIESKYVCQKHTNNREKFKDKISVLVRKIVITLEKHKKLNNNFVLITTKLYKNT